MIKTQCSQIILNTTFKPRRFCLMWKTFVGHLWHPLPWTEPAGLFEEQFTQRSGHCNTCAKGRFFINVLAGCVLFLNQIKWCEKENAFVFLLKLIIASFSPKVITNELLTVCLWTKTCRSVETVSGCLSLAALWWTGCLSRLSRLSRSLSAWIVYSAPLHDPL